MLVSSMCTAYTSRNNAQKIYINQFVHVFLGIQSGLSYMNLFIFSSLASHYVRKVWLRENVNMFTSYLNDIQAGEKWALKRDDV